LFLWQISKCEYPHYILIPEWLQHLLFLLQGRSFDSRQEETILTEDKLRDSTLIRPRSLPVKQWLCRKIWGFHGGDFEEWCLLGCYAVWLL
jgi:hypothetical protein